MADDKERSARSASTWITHLCGDVLAAGAPGLQFFTLNRSTATVEILGRLRDPGVARAS